MSGGKLNKTLIVRNPDTYVAVALLEGTDLPEWATDLVHLDDLDASKTPVKKTPARASAND